MEFNHGAEKSINQCLYKKTPGKTMDTEAWVNSPGGQYSCILPHIHASGGDSPSHWLAFPE